MKPTRKDFKHPKSPLRETITTLLTEQTFLEFSHILLAEKIPVQCWALDVFHIWFHSWKWAPRHHYSPDISGLTHEVMSSCCPAVWCDERLVMHIKWFSIIRLKCLIQSSYWVRFFIFKAEWVAILRITSLSGLIICYQCFYLPWVTPERKQTFQSALKMDVSNSP